MRPPLLALVLAAAAWADVSFQTRQGGEALADLELSGPEGSLAAVSVDGTERLHVTLFAGPQRHRYRVRLGALATGAHRLAVQGATLHGASVRESAEPVDAHAPVLFARRNTLGRFSDVPLLLYAERLVESGQPLLQYTVVFSNEDGGTSTRALMARWGRATDIEYVYKVVLDEAGRRRRATIQARNHQEVEFTGPFDGDHPLLLPVTDNNMVSGEGTSPVRYQLAPKLVDLSDRSREQVMDDEPVTYAVMARELEREAKLRPFGTVQGQLISDPRNYLFLEMRLTNQGAGVAALVRLKGESRWRSSHLGRADYAIGRPGWVRTTVELPPGTRPEQVEEIGFQCVLGVDGGTAPPTGRCRVEAVRTVFLLGRDYLPQPGFWSLAAPMDLSPGEMVAHTVRR